MSINWDKEFNFESQNNKKSKINWEEEFNFDKKDIIKPTFTQRMTGEPVRQKDGTYTATTDITEFLSGLPLFGAFARMGKTLGETMAYNQLDDKTREYLAKTGTTTDIVPDITRSNLEVAADAAEAMTDAATGGLRSLFTKGVMQSGKLIASKTLREAERKLLASQIMKRFGIETGLNTASGYSFDVAQNAREGKKGVEVFKPGIGAGGAFFLSSILGGRSAAQLQKANSASRKFNIPNAGSPFDNFKPTKVGLTDNVFVNKPAEKLNVNIQPGARYITPKVTPKTQMESRALKSQSKNDFISSEVGFMNRTKQPLSSNFMKKVNNTWEKMHPKPIQEKITTPRQSKLETPTVGQPKINTQTHQYDSQGFRPVKEGEIIPNGYTTKMNTQTGEQMTNAPFKETPTVETPKIREERITKDAKVFSKDFPDYEKGTFEKWSDELNSIPREELENVANGGSKTIPTTVPEGAYLSKMKNIADEEGNIELINKLSDSNVISKGAQTTVSAKMAKEGNNADFLRSVKKDILESKGFNNKKAQKELTQIINELKRKLNEVSSSKLDNNYIDEIINNLMC